MGMRRRHELLCEVYCNFRCRVIISTAEEFVPEIFSEKCEKASILASSGEFRVGRRKRGI
jgi:hypothetical protein